jgi:hypothetical protein
LWQLDKSSARQFPQSLSHGAILKELQEFVFAKFLAADTFSLGDEISYRLLSPSA